ncbi:MAG: hypothetical protein AAF748_13185 [Pseudomonadota bacterium]
MNMVKAYLSVALFGGFGVYVAAGGLVSKDPDCWGRCFSDTLAQLIDRIGPLPASGILFFCAIFSFFYWKARA